MEIKVSICIPTYNQTEFLKKNLESILCQTYKNYEVIISDDSTNNDVKNLVENIFYQTSIKYSYYKNEKSLGSPANWNNAISLANGEYIKIMHHDDWFTDELSLSKFIDCTVLNNEAFIFSQAISLNEKENIKKIHSPSLLFLEQLKINPEYVFLGNLIGPPSSVLFKKNNFNLFDEKLKWLVDIDFYINQIKKNNSFYFINEPLITSVNNANHNITNNCINPETEIFEYFYLYNKLSNKFKLEKETQQLLIDLLIRYNIKNVTDFLKFSTFLEVEDIIRTLIKKSNYKIITNKIKSIFNVN